MVDGLFDTIEVRLMGLLRTPRRLLAAIVWGAGLLSGLMTNDAVCLLGAPLVVRWTKRGRLPPVPFLLALATAANTGSAATLVGNPQNMLCGWLGHLEYLPYLLVAGPIVLVSLGINHAVLLLAYRRALPAVNEAAERVGAPTEPLRRGQLWTLAVVGATVVAYLAGADLAWAACGGFVVLVLLHRGGTAPLWRHIDGALLLFFSGLFVVVEGLRSSGLPGWWFARFPLAELYDAAGLPGVASVFMLGSNVVSNVPFILVVQQELARLGDPSRAWTLLALVSTFAGNLTLLGSAANVIVAEASRDVGGFGFREHFRVGAPIAALTTFVAVGWLWLLE